jgi:hypothetical protein
MALRYLFQRLFDASSDSDIPKNVPFTLVINTLLPTPVLEKVKHSFFGLALSGFATFRLATIYLPKILLLKWGVVKYYGVPLPFLRFYYDLSFPRDTNNN